jgi:uncharacterized protein YkwD
MRHFKSIKIPSMIAFASLLLLTSCLPQSVDNTSGNSPRRTTNTIGDNSGATNSVQDPQNPISNGTAANNNNGSTNNTANSNGNSNGSPNGITNGDASCYKGDPFICKIEQLIGEKTNKYRAGRGLKPLVLDAKLAFTARDWSQKQAKSGGISHNGFPSARQTVYRQEFNVSRGLHGENVAYTSGVNGDSARNDAAAEAVAKEFAVMWWNSSGHRANMLGSFNYLGVGIFQRSNGAWYATQIFD